MFASKAVKQIASTLFTFSGVHVFRFGTHDNCLAALEVDSRTSQLTMWPGTRGGCCISQRYAAFQNKNTCNVIRTSPIGSLSWLRGKIRDRSPKMLFRVRQQTYDAERLAFLRSCGRVCVPIRRNRLITFSEARFHRKTDQNSYNVRSNPPLIGQKVLVCLAPRARKL